MKIDVYLGCRDSLCCPNRPVVSTINPCSFSMLDGQKGSNIDSKTDRIESKSLEPNIHDLLEIEKRREVKFLLKELGSTF